MFDRYGLVGWRGLEIVKGWDNEVVDYDYEKFPWYDRILGAIQEINPDCDTIEYLHMYFNREQIVPLRKHLERFVRSDEFSGWVDDYFDAIIGDSLGEYLIQSTPTMNVVLPDQQRQGSMLTFHTGHWTAYNNGMYTIWTPVSKARGNNSMQVVSWEDSVEITKELYENKHSISWLQERCSEVSYPVEINQGQAWLFHQGHWHGNVNNDTGISRIGLDIRAMVKGTDYHYRKPGGYFRFPKTKVSPPSVDSDRRWIVFNDPAASDYMGSMPFHIARNFIETYIEKLNIKPVGWHNEYTLTDWNPHLEFFIEETEVQGIALLSAHALSSSVERRLELLRKCIDRDIQVLFCDENFVLNTTEDLQYIERILRF